MVEINTDSNEVRDGVIKEALNAIRAIPAIEYFKHTDNGVVIDRDTLNNNIMLDPVVSKFEEIRKGFGLQAARLACDALAVREIAELGKLEKNHPAFFALNFYRRVRDGDISSSEADIMLGWEMKGAYHRYLAKNAPRALSRAQHMVVAMRYSLLPKWGGIGSNYLDIARDTLLSEKSR